MSLPVRTLGKGRILVAAILIAAVAAWLPRTDIANGVSSIVDSAAAALKAVDSPFHAQTKPPDAFAVACSERGGTVVEARGRDGTSIRRCATSFDDGVR